MIIIFVKPRERELGTVGGYRIFESAQTLYLFFIPTFSWNRRVYAKDDSGRILLLSEEAGREIRRGTKNELYASDFVECVYEEPHEKKCPYCGFTTTENYLYCPKCGEKLQ